MGGLALIAALLLSAIPGWTATLYVDLNNPAPVPPYTNWIAAATNIQDAVDAAMAGDVILATNGVYQAGAREIYGMSNRVAVTKSVTVQSVNGPEVTTIVGYQVPGTTNGVEAVRCVYLMNGAVLVGFTLTGGATQPSGDQQYKRQQAGGGVWCESTSAVVSNCVLAGNSAQTGGGAFRGTLNNCTLVGNLANAGGGASGGMLFNCTLMSNSVVGSFNIGGGAWDCTLNNCMLAGNSASDFGGGIYRGTLNRCTLAGNSARFGGGAAYSTLNQCALTGNSAYEAGGGTYFGTLNNCTLTGNSSIGSFSGGGGASSGTLNNCLIYYNTSTTLTNNNYAGSTLNFCCTTPLPANGASNFTAEPQLAGNWHLSASSPCIGAGSAAYASGLDLDGEPWANPPSIGCDEYWSSSVTGALSVEILAAYTNVAVGFNVDFQAVVGGRVNGSRWDFGDGVVVSNRPYASHAWAEAGAYEVELRAGNEDNPAGMAARISVQVIAQPVNYVTVDCLNPVPPYNSWNTAATNIQDAVDAAVPGALVLVSNGVYQSGARALFGMSNRVAVTKPVTLQSVNGAGVTLIVGHRDPDMTNGSTAVRCVYLTNGAALVGFTLTNGATQMSGDVYRQQEGGGVFCESASGILSNCVLTGNSAYAAAGAAYTGMLHNCVLTANSALTGATHRSTLNNCTVTGNSGGGVFKGTVNNSIVYYNIGNQNYISVVSLNHCCTTPLPLTGVGNFTNEPAFVDLAGDLRLQSNSPCINAGLNAFAPGATDFDGRPRIVGGTVDVGAYEFQNPASVISYAWLHNNGLPTDGSADSADPDGDGHNNWQEWRAGTAPLDAASVLRLLSVAGATNGLTLAWPSVSGLFYFLERSTNLAGSPRFTTFATNLIGQPGTNTYPDTNAPVSGPVFYRVGVQP